MARFEDAIQWVMNNGRARRRCWATVQEYTRTTPPLNCERRWRIWMSDYGIMQGWGNQIGGTIDPNEPIRDGTNYKPSDADRLADDWEQL
jgi:hypothetical protein